MVSEHFCSFLFGFWWLALGVVCDLVGLRRSRILITSLGLPLLFAAGMGIGLMFFGVLEPVYHMANIRDRWVYRRLLGQMERLLRKTSMPPKGWVLRRPRSVGAASMGNLCCRRARVGTFLVQQGIAFDDPVGLLPNFSVRLFGAGVGHLIDILAVFATLFGLATSLGFGAQQANAGLQFVFGVPVNATVQVVLIAGITAIALVSVVRGLEVA